MMNEAEIRERIEQHRSNLAGWREPDGYLVPTEPDADERARVRDRLQAAIRELERVLAAGAANVRVPYARG